MGTSLSAKKAKDYKYVLLGDARHAKTEPVYDGMTPGGADRHSVRAKAVASVWLAQ